MGSVLLPGTWYDFFSGMTLMVATPVRPREPTTNTMVGNINIWCCQPSANSVSTDQHEEDRGAPPVPYASLPCMAKLGHHVVECRPPITQWPLLL